MPKGCDNERSPGRRWVACDISPSGSRDPAVMTRPDARRIARPSSWVGPDEVVVEVLGHGEREVSAPWGTGRSCPGRGAPPTSGTSCRNSCSTARAPTYTSHARAGPLLRPSPAVDRAGRGPRLRGRPAKTRFVGPAGPLIRRLRRGRRQVVLSHLADDRWLGVVGFDGEALHLWPIDDLNSTWILRALRAARLGRPDAIRFRCGLAVLGRAGPHSARTSPVSVSAGQCWPCPEEVARSGSQQHPDNALWAGCVGEPMVSGQELAAKDLCECDIRGVVRRHVGP